MITFKSLHKFNNLSLKAAEKIMYPIPEHHRQTDQVIYAANGQLLEKLKLNKKSFFRSIKRKTHFLFGYLMNVVLTTKL